MLYQPEHCYTRSRYSVILNTYTLSIQYHAILMHKHSRAIMSRDKTTWLIDASTTTQVILALANREEQRMHQLDRAGYEEIIIKGAGQWALHERERMETTLLRR